MPFFIHFTAGFSREQRRRTIRVAAISAFVVIAVSALAGLRIIEFFGISLASFQVGGGMLLLMSSLQMLNAQPAESRTQRPRRGQRQGRRRRLDRDRAADDPAADRPGDDLDDGDLRREDAPLVGARGAGRLRRRHRPGGLDRVRPRRAASPGSLGQHRHQRHDAADGPAARRARGRGDVGRPGQAVPGAASRRRCR